VRRVCRTPVALQRPVMALANSAVMRNLMQSFNQILQAFLANERNHNRHPKIAEGDWIKVAVNDCVVRMLYPVGSASGVCSVVINKAKATTRDVAWNGEN
jgi:hypothetical protein